MRSYLIYVGAIFLLISTSLSAKTERYELKDLGTLGGQFILATALNDRDQVTGFGTNIDGKFESFLYSDGRLHVIGPLTGSHFRSTTPFGMNNHDEIVGALGLEAAFHAFSYRHGVLTDIAQITGNFGFSDSQADAVNDAGLIVGILEDAMTSTSRAFAYFHGALNDLGTLGGLSSEATAVSSNGLITGSADTKLPVNPDNMGNEAVQPHAFIYAHGTLRDLGTLGGVQSVGLGINSTGEVVGTSFADDSEYPSAFVYRGGKMINLGLGYFSSAQGINEDGDVVGAANEAADSWAFLYKNGKVTNLATVIDRRTPVPPNVTLAARAINNRGVILVNGYNTATERESIYLLIPIREGGKCCSIDEGGRRH